jgi:tetratricopeptide (TPR) repeat protein
MRLPVRHAVLLAALATACHAHPEGQRLLAEGQYDELLRRVRPTSGAACWLRARALRAQGRVRQARTELLVGLTHDPASAEGHRLLGYLEAALGNEGAALSAFARSLERAPRQPEVRRAVARLLVRRALLRVDPAVGLRDAASAKADLDRAISLDTSLAPRGRELRAALVAPPSSWPGGGEGCPDSQRSPDGWAPPARSRCEVRDAGRYLEQLQRRRLLLGCEGSRLARRLAGHGCHGEALDVWRALTRETPSDGRWLLEAARTLLVLGRATEAILVLGEQVYLGPDRAASALRAARALIAAGHRRPAARFALDAITLTRRIDQVFEGAQLLRDAGMVKEARAVIGTVARGDVRARLEQALGL